MHDEPASPVPVRLGPGDQQACEALDRLALDGLWSGDQWAHELQSPTSTVLALRASSRPVPGQISPGAQAGGPIRPEGTTDWPQARIDRPEPLIALACSRTIVDECHVLAVAVDGRWRRRGLALLLLTALLDQARAQGCLRATLEVDGSNAAAVALYRRLGFATAGIRRAYYRSGGDALIQWADL